MEVLPYLGGLDLVLPCYDAQEMVLPYQGALDWDLPCCDDLDWDHCGPFLGSGLPCQDVMKDPLVYCLDGMMVPLEHFLQEVYQGLIHEDYQIQGHLV